MFRNRIKVIIANVVLFAFIVTPVILLNNSNRNSEAPRKGTPPENIPSEETHNENTTSEKTPVFENVEFEVPGWERNRSRNASHYIFPNEKTALIEPSNVCQDNTPILLLFVITSATNNFENRELLRKTWASKSHEFNYNKFTTIHSKYTGKYSPISYPHWRNFTEKQKGNENEDVSHTRFQIRHIFLIGQTNNTHIQSKIEEEARINNDLLQERFIDSYNNLTLKSIMMLKYVNNNCAQTVKFVAKVDDDVFVNVPNLIHYLLGGSIPVYKDNQNTRLTKWNETLIGHRYYYPKPKRDIQNKWYMPYYMHPEEYYPDYVAGCAYVFSMDAAEKLYEAALASPVIHMEDAFLTGICAKKADIVPQHNSLFIFHPKSLCKARGVIAIFGLQKNDLRKAYDLVLKTNLTC